MVFVRISYFLFPVGLARVFVGMAVFCRNSTGARRNGTAYVGMARGFVRISVFLPECQAFVGMLVIMSEHLFMCQFRAAPYNIYHCKEIAHDHV